MGSVKLMCVDDLLGTSFRKEHDVEALKKSILDDKKELIRLRTIIEDLIQNGIPHSSFSGDCCDGSNESLKTELKKAFNKVLE